jgi:hypothetical protein
MTTARYEVGAFLILAAVAISFQARADQCDRVRAFLGGQAADLVCFESPDLTTNYDPAPPNSFRTTPFDNSIAGLPPLAFTPRTDRAVISLGTTITKAVPGVQVQGRFANDPTGQARFLLRFPRDWNGKLVVAGASGTRSEFNGDFAWSDFVLQKGYAYASQNKGVLNLRLSTATDPLACRLNPTSTVFVHFFDNDPEKPFSQWQQYMVSAAALARGAANAHYSSQPQRTYAVGTSNGGYQVRRAVELAPELFDGGIDWEGTFIDPNGPNILIDLPPAIRYFPPYVASGFDPDSDAAQNIRGSGYPPDVINARPIPPGTSLWLMNYNQFWEVTQCQWQKRFDPTYDTYGAGPGNYDYFSRVQSHPEVAARLAEIETTGDIKRPLITLSGTLDGLLPIERQARAYAAKVAAHQRLGMYRLYEVQNGNHVESYKLSLPQIELIQPHAQRAFDLLVAHVEAGQELPPDQCIPRGGQIIPGKEESGQCEALFVP